MAEPYYADDSVTLYHSDALDVLRSLDAGSVDAVVTDPPYGLEFMGKDWDRFAGKVSDRDFKGFVLSQQRTRNVKCPDCQRWAYDHPGRACECGGVRRAQGSAYQEWCGAWASECLRVLKPGAHLLAFGGTRTVHRLACAVEDAGFEIRDGIDWLYGSGFPKSLDVSKAIDKAAGVEREVVGPRLRLGDKRAYAYNAEDYDGAVFGERSERIATAPATDDARRWQGWGTALKPAREPIVVARKPLAGTVAANVQEYGTGALNIDACRVGDDTSRGDRYNGKPPSGDGFLEHTMTHNEPWSVPAGRWPPNVVLDERAAAELDRQSGASVSPDRPVKQGGNLRVGGIMNDSGVPREGKYGVGYGDSGGASRFFPVFRYEAKAPTVERPRADGVAHPTVKPLDLMRWLVRLVTPPGGTVLDPFAGSGTTGEACVAEGFRCLLVEREATYLPLIVARLSKPIPLALFGEAS